jgi:hypothetical protein
MKKQRKGKTKPPSQKTGNDFPDYPLYPPEEDIYSKLKEDDKNVEYKNLAPNEEPGKPNEKDFEDDMTGSDLDVPGSELDDDQEIIGSEDEENNYYSLGDNQDDLLEDK